MNWGDLIVDVEPAGTVTLRDMLKTYTGGCDHSVDYDDAFDTALEIAGHAMETYLDRVIAKRAVDEYFPHHFGTVELHNPQIDTSEPITVNLNGNTQTDYQIWLQRGKVGHLSRIGHSHDVPMDWRKFDQVTVTYSAGYDPIPSDLANAITWTASLVYAANGTGSIPGGGGTGEIKSMSIHDVGSMSFDVGSSSSASGDAYGSAGIIPSTAAEMVSRYKRMSA